MAKYILKCSTIDPATGNFYIRKAEPYDELELPEHIKRNKLIAIKLDESIEVVEESTISDIRELTTNPDTDVSTKFIGAVKSKIVVNLNTASMDQLRTVSGVGQKLAQKIIDNRPYETIDDINKKVPNVRSWDTYNVSI